ncbi:hypothetical protein DV515_00012225 [Chloebia gouldiae]|uniref:Uncharacterized protein n=1 Tax=Chloebia gouldiae TaxID=44316 RepID=A0A3L8S4S3_CHLGU|nr:hypothetical protein DV515_00012225 [Chloebia gouldiae]
MPPTAAFGISVPTIWTWATSSAGCKVPPVAVLVWLGIGNGLLPLLTTTYTAFGILSSGPVLSSHELLYEEENAIAFPAKRVLVINFLAGMALQKWFSVLICHILLVPAYCDRLTGTPFGSDTYKQPLWGLKYLDSTLTLTTPNQSSAATTLSCASPDNLQLHNGEMKPSGNVATNIKDILQIYSIIHFYCEMDWNNLYIFQYNGQGTEWTD